jgi:hypothetical protein
MAKDKRVTERERFEKWATRYAHISTERQHSFHGWTYIHATTEWAWRAYKLARSRRGGKR